MEAKPHLGSLRGCFSWKQAVWAPDAQRQHQNVQGGGWESNLFLTVLAGIWQGNAWQLTKTVSLTRSGLQEKARTWTHTHTQVKVQIKALRYQLNLVTFFPHLWLLHTSSPPQGYEVPAETLGPGVWTKWREQWQVTASPWSWSHLQHCWTGSLETSDHGEEGKRHWPRMLVAGTF